MMPGRRFNRRKIITTALLGLGFLGLLVFVSVRYAKQVRSQPVAAKEAPTESLKPSDDLTARAQSPYQLIRDVEQPRLPPTELEALRNRLAMLEGERAEDRKAYESQLAQLRADLAKKPQPTAAKPANNNGDEDRRRQEARERAKAEAAELKASREATTTMISHVNDEDKSKVVKATSAYWLTAGSVVNCQLESGINSEHQVPVVARVTSSVYDSDTGRIVVMPQDATLIGSYKGLAVGDDTVDVTWETLSYGKTTIELQGQPGGDRTGQAGLEGEIDHKVGTIITAVLTGSLFTAGTAAIATGGNDTGERIAGAAASNAMRQTQNQITRTINPQPTIHVEPGTPCTLTLKKSLDLDPRGT